MDLNTLISRGLDENKLKCFLCHNYLSYFPITISNNQSICGRCEALEIRCPKNEAFEALCQFLRFPCRYKFEGCCEELLPEDVPQHERNCQYRVVPCIVNNPKECNWIGSLPLLFSHCRKEHSELILKTGEFELNLSVSEEKGHLIENENSFLIFNTKFDVDSKVLTCSIRYDQYRTDCDSRTYQLKLQNGDTTLSLSLNTTNYKNLCLQSIITKNTSKVWGKIFTTGEETVTESVSVNIFEQTNQELVSLLKCFVCSEFVKPPVYSCLLRNNALCRFCKDGHIKKCQPCKNGSTEASSLFATLYQLVLYPCPNQKNGCSSKLKWNEFLPHDAICKYKDDFCPLNESHSCTWEGLESDISNHLLTEHSDIIVNSSIFEASLNGDEVEEKCGIVKFSGCLFLISYFITRSMSRNFVEKKYMWCVKTIEDYKEKFMYELEIVDSGSERRLTQRQKCIKMGEAEFCHFDITQLGHFGKGEHSGVSFKIRIIK